MIIIKYLSFISTKQNQTINFWQNLKVGSKKKCKNEMFQLLWNGGNIKQYAVQDTKILIKRKDVYVDYTYLMMDNAVLCKTNVLSSLHRPPQSSNQSSISTK